MQLLDDSQVLVLTAMGPAVVPAPALCNISDTKDAGFYGSKRTCTVALFVYCSSWQRASLKLVPPRSTVHRIVVCMLERYLHQRQGLQRNMTQVEAGGSDQALTVVSCLCN